jgi:hypothetical protein
MAYPQWAKKPRASRSLTAERAPPVASTSASKLLDFALLSRPFTFEKAS